MGPPGRLVTIKRSGLDGPHFPLSLRSCLFGRGIECDIRIQLPVVSKQHCRIEISEQKAVLFNLSATNPTQVNGCAIDGPVPLRHGDVITVIDRSFRYENDSHQHRRKSTEFPGQRPEQASPHRISRSSFSSDPDEEVQDPSAACSQLTDGASGGPPERGVDFGAARAVSRGSEGTATRSPADGPSSETPRDNPRDNRRNAAAPPAGGFSEGARLRVLSRKAGRESLPASLCLGKDGEDDSPFRKLYESMKEELDVKSEKENIPQSHRRSRSGGRCASESKSAEGSQGEPRLWLSPASRRGSGRSSQTEGGRAGAGPGHTLQATASPGVPPTELTKAKTPVQRSQQNSSGKRQSGGLSVTRGGEPVSPERSEGFGADSAVSTPRRLSARQQTPAQGDSTADLGNTPEKGFSRKRQRSLPPSVGVLTADADIQEQALGPPLPAGTPEQLGAAAGSPGLSCIDVSNVGDSLNKAEGRPLKRRRVSFGGHLRPELFDENLPPNTPLTRGETPMRRRSLATHTPTALKKIIKEPHPSGKGDSSEIGLEGATQNVLTSSPARNPTKTSPGANDSRRGSKSPGPSGSKSPRQTDTPKRAGRRSGGPAGRASAGRSQRGVLQLVHSRRRSGASEANLMVARSWADVVKLCTKQTQAKVVRHGPPRQPSRRQRRVNTPKKLPGSVHNEFSTGHATSPCTIVIGRAHIEKVSAPARPYRMLNNFAINRKIDFNEDLSGLPEMFKTPAKENPQAVSICPTTFSDSEDLLGEKFQAPNSEEKPLLCTPEKFGEAVFPGAQNAPEEPLDKKPPSPAFTSQCVTVNGNRKTPRSEAEPPKAGSRAKKFRRSVELRNIRLTGTESEKDHREAEIAQSILGRCLRKSAVQAKLLGEEMKESERPSETWKRNIEPKGNSEQLVTVRRSRRSSELKCTPRADLMAIQRSQEMESQEDLVGAQSFLRTPCRAEEPGDTETKTTVVHCAPPPASTPTKGGTWIKMPPQSVDAEDLSALRKSTHTPGDMTYTHKEAVGGDQSMRAFKEAPEQKLDSSDNATRRRMSRTPRRKLQPVEDLAGFKELFQTPIHTVEPVTGDKSTKTPCRSPKPEPVSTPSSAKRRRRTPVGKVDVEEEPSALRKLTPRGREATPSHTEPEEDEKSTELFKKTPKQKLDSEENVTGSRRRSRTPKRKVQPIEDLAGFKELFQTPVHKIEPMTDENTTNILCQSPQPQAVITPISTTRRLKTPPGKMDLEEGLSGLGQPAPGETTRSHREPEGGEGSIRAFKETPEQTLELSGSRRRSRTPKRKIQPIEDLLGFKELFQTPIHTVAPVTNGKTTKIPCKSPKSEPVSTPTSIKKHFRTPLGKVDSEEEFSALRKLTPRPGETTHSHRVPEGEDKSAEFFKKTPKQKLYSAENITGNRRRSRTPRRKVQPIEDLVGFKELFETPDHITETGIDDKTKITCKSPQAKPVSTPTSIKSHVRTSLGEVHTEEEPSALGKPTPGETTRSHREPEGDEKSIKAFKETPEQKLDSAENVTGSKRRSRTPRRKTQPIEDLAGFKELFQTPDHIVETVSEGKSIKTPCRSPKPEPVSTPTSTKRRLRSPLGTVHVEEEPWALRKPAAPPGQTTHSHRQPEGDEFFTETPEQKLGSAENITGGRGKSRTPRRKTQPIEDLAGFKELFQTPIHILETVVDVKTTKLLCQSPQPGPASTPRSMTRGLRTPPGKVDLEEGLWDLGKPAPGETTPSHREPEGGDEDIKAFKEIPEQNLDSAENKTGSSRRSRTPKRKVEPIEDLAGFKELFQTPVHIIETVTDGKSTKTPRKPPKPEPVSTPTSTKRRRRTPVGKVDVEEEPWALGKPAAPPGQTTLPHTEPEGAEESTELFTETPKQKLDSTENVPGSRRRSRTPKRKVQPTEDLAGFKELFQTPDHVMDPVTEGKTPKIPCKPPKPAPVKPTGRSRRAKAPPGTEAIADELPALGRPTRASGKTRSQREPELADKDRTSCKEIPEQISDPVENVTGSKRGPRTRKGKAQPLEDPAGLKEPLQMPSPTETLVKAAEMPSRCAQPEAAAPARRTRQVKAPPRKGDVEEEPSAPRRPPRTVGKATRSRREPEVADNDVDLFKEIPEQKLDPAENVTGSKRRPRTRKGKAQPLEDPAGLKEPLQMPSPTETLVKAAEMSSTCAQPEAAAPARKTRQVKAPPRKGDVEEEPSAPRRPPRTVGKATRSRREPEVADKDVTLIKEIPEQTSDPAENVTGSKRRPRTRKGKAQPLEDPAGLKEPLQMPSRVDEPEAGAAVPARREGQVQAGPGEEAVEQGPSARRTAGKATRSRREPAAGDQDIQVLKETPGQKPGPEENAKGSRRPLRPRKGQAQPPQGPAPCKQLSQSPAEGKAPGPGAEGLPRTPARAPDPRKPARPRRVLRPPNVKPVEDQGGSRDPVESQRGSSASLSPERRRGDGGPPGPRRLRTRACAQDPAEGGPPQKRQRAAPPERSEPLESVGVRKRRGAVARSTEPVAEEPSGDMKTKTRGRGVPVATAPDKGVSLRSQPPSNPDGAEPRPEIPVSAGEAAIKRGRKPVTTSPEVKAQHPDCGARVRERRACLRPGTRGGAPLPSGAQEPAGETQEVGEGAQHPGCTRSRSRKGTAPPSGDPLESQSKQKGTRNAKRPAGETKQEDEDTSTKKMRTRGRRGRDDV